MNGRTNSHQHLSVVFALMSPALAVAACGSSTKSSGTNAASSQYAQAIRYADCMRSHGASNFPDPSASGGFELTSSGITSQSPAYQSAHEACADPQPGGIARPSITAAQQQGMRAKALCIREHGAPNSPDPTFRPGGEGVNASLRSRWNPQAPAVEKAAKACLHAGTLIPGAGLA